MGDRRRAHCTCCGKHRKEVGEISWAGNCMGCALELFEENARGISEKRGPAHRRRLRGYARMIERQLLDEAAATP